jgi:hypothetical protein
MFCCSVGLYYVQYLLCLLNCITDTIQMTEGLILASLHMARSLTQHTHITRSSLLSTHRTVSQYARECNLIHGLRWADIPKIKKPAAELCADPIY